MLDLDSMHRQSKPKHLLIPEDLSNQIKFQKLDELVVGERMMDGSIEPMVSAKERQELLQQLGLNPDGRFSYHFPDCTASFKSNGKSRRRHEQGHDPPVDISDDLPSTTESPHLHHLRKLTIMTTTLHFFVRGYLSYELLGCSV